LTPSCPWSSISPDFDTIPPVPHSKGFWYPPGLIYDLAFRRMFRGLRRRVARTVEKEGLYPWLDVCSGTGDQLRGHASGRSRGHVPSVRVSVLDSDFFRGHVSNLGSSGGDQVMHGGKLALGLDMSFGFVRYAAARATGAPFVCGDAGRLPFKDGSMRAVSISFGLHDKSPALRKAIIQEVRRALGPDGKLIAVDFEKPWNARSKAGTLFARSIERLAGGEHYRNSREFLSIGGLGAFLRTTGFVEVDRRDVEAGSLAVVVARPGR